MRKYPFFVALLFEHLWLEERQAAAAEPDRCALSFRPGSEIGACLLRVLAVPSAKQLSNSFRERPTGRSDGQIELKHESFNCDQPNHSSSSTLESTHLMFLITTFRSTLEENLDQYWEQHLDQHFNQHYIHHLFVHVRLFTSNYHNRHINGLLVSRHVMTLLTQWCLYLVT
jgi:hypothetical protein